MLLLLALALAHADLFVCQYTGTFETHELDKCMNLKYNSEFITRATDTTFTRTVYDDYNCQGEPSSLTGTIEEIFPDEDCSYGPLPTYLAVQWRTITGDCTDGDTAGARKYFEEGCFGKYRNRLSENKTKFESVDYTEDGCTGTEDVRMSYPCNECWTNNQVTNMIECIIPPDDSSNSGSTSSNATPAGGDSSSRSARVSLVVVLAALLALIL